MPQRSGTVDTPYQNVDHLYCLHEMWDPSRRSLSYGILVKECVQGYWSYDVPLLRLFLQQQVCRSWVN